MIGMMCLTQVSYAHRFYAAFTQIDLREKKQTIEIVHRLFTHDVEDFLSMERGNISGLSDKEIEPIIRDFVEKNFSMRDGNGKNIPLKWIGMEYETDNVHVYQEAVLPQSHSKFIIINKIFMSLFEEQKNTVNMEWNDQIRTRIFLRGHTQQTVDFKGAD